MEWHAWLGIGLLSIWCWVLTRFAEMTAKRLRDDQEYLRNLDDRLAAVEYGDDEGGRWTLVEPPDDDGPLLAEAATQVEPERAVTLAMVPDDDEQSFDAEGWG